MAGGALEVGVDDVDSSLEMSLLPSLAQALRWCHTAESARWRAEPGPSLLLPAQLLPELLRFELYPVRVRRRDPLWVATRELAWAAPDMRRAPVTAARRPTSGIGPRLPLQRRTKARLERPRRTLDESVQGDEERVAIAPPASHESPHLCFHVLVAHLHHEVTPQAQRPHPLPLPVLMNHVVAVEEDWHRHERGEYLLASGGALPPSASLAHGRLGWTPQSGSGSRRESHRRLLPVAAYCHRI